MSKSDLKSARTRVGMSQGQLAKKLKVSLGSISLWEGGKGIPHGKNVAKVKRFIASANARPAPTPAAKRTVHVMTDAKGYKKPAKKPKEQLISVAKEMERRGLVSADYAVVPGQPELTRKGKTRVACINLVGGIGRLADYPLGKSTALMIVESANALELSFDDLIEMLKD